MCTRNDPYRQFRKPATAQEFVMLWQVLIIIELTFKPQSWYMISRQVVEFR